MTMMTTTMMMMMMVVVVLMRGCADVNRVACYRALSATWNKQLLTKSRVCQVQPWLRRWLVTVISIFSLSCAHIRVGSFKSQSLKSLINSGVKFAHIAEISNKVAGGLLFCTHPVEKQVWWLSQLLVGFSAWNEQAYVMMKQYGSNNIVIKPEFLIFKHKSRDFSTLTYNWCWALCMVIGGDWWLHQCWCCVMMMMIMLLVAGEAEQWCSEALGEWSSRSCQQWQHHGAGLYCTDMILSIVLYNVWLIEVSRCLCVQWLLSHYWMHLSYCLYIHLQLQSLYCHVQLWCLSACAVTVSVFTSAVTVSTFARAAVISM